MLTLRAQRLGPYHLLEPIAPGRDAAVYLAQHQDGLQRLALKVLEPPHEADRAAFAQFLKDLSTLRAHPIPGLMPTWEAGILEGFPYICMSFCSNPLLGLSLSSIKRLSQEELLTRLSSVARSLALLHEAGLVHGNLKPTNILHLEGSDVLSDLGLSSWRVTRRQARLNSAEARYMAPEFTPDLPPTRASDLFSLATIAYQLLTGSHPQESRSEGAGAKSPLPVVPQLLVPGLSPRAGHALMEALEPDPSQRLADAHRLADRLAGSHPLPRPERPSRPPLQAGDSPGEGIRMRREGGRGEEPSPFSRSAPDSRLNFSGEPYGEVGENALEAEGASSPERREREPDEARRQRVPPPPFADLHPPLEPPEARPPLSARSGRLLQPSMAFGRARAGAMNGRELWEKEGSLLHRPRARGQGEEKAPGEGEQTGRWVRRGALAVFAVICVAITIKITPLKTDALEVVEEWESHPLGKEGKAVSHENEASQGNAQISDAQISDAHVSKPSVPLLTATPRPLSEPGATPYLEVTPEPPAAPAGIAAPELSLIASPGGEKPPAARGTVP